MRSWTDFLLPVLFGALAMVPASRATIEPPVLRLSMEAEPATLDWSNPKSASHRLILAFLMRGLLKYDASGTPVCDLCKSFAIRASGDAFEFVLGTEEWSDGTRLTAQNFVDAFQRLKAPQISNSKALAPDRLEIKVSQSPALLTHLLTTELGYPVRKELLTGGADDGVNHAQTAVLGAYSLAAWEKGKRIVLEGNPKHQGPRPVYRVEFVLGNRATQIKKFKAGKLDILTNVTTEDLVNLPGQRVDVSPYLATRQLIMNFKRPLIADPRLRRTLLYGIAREKLPVFLRNGERKVTGLIPPGLTGYRELPLVTSDITRAREERKLIPSGEGPKPLELELVFHNLETDRKVANWIAEELGRLQIKLKLSPKSAGEYLDALARGRFDLALETWEFGISSPADILQAYTTGSRQNRGGFTSVAYDDWVSKLLSRPKPLASEPAEWIDRATQVLETQEVSVIPLGYPTQPFLLGRRVVSFAITPYGDPDLVRIQLKH